ncbi:DUF3953 domain-containing protein [Bacillus sp. 3103sda1]
MQNFKKKQTSAGIFLFFTGALALYVSISELLL